MAPGLILASGWFLVFLIGQIATFHVTNPGRRSKTALGWFAFALAGYLATVALLFASPQAIPGALAFKPWLSLVGGLLLLACLFVLYMPFFYIVHTSLSVDTLVRVAQVTGGRIERERLTAVYASSAFAADRIRTLYLNGYLKPESGDQHTLTTRGRRVTRPFVFLQRVWKLGMGG